MNIGGTGGGGGVNGTGVDPNWFTPQGVRWAQQAYNPQENGQEWDTQNETRQQFMARSGMGGQPGLAGSLTQGGSQGPFPPAHPPISNPYLADANNPLGQIIQQNAGGGGSKSFSIGTPDGGPSFTGQVQHPPILQLPQQGGLPNRTAPDGRILWNGNTGVWFGQNPGSTPTNSQQYGVSDSGVTDPNSPVNSGDITQDPNLRFLGGNLPGQFTPDRLSQNFSPDPMATQLGGFFSGTVPRAQDYNQFLSDSGNNITNQITGANNYNTQLGQQANQGWNNIQSYLDQLQGMNSNYGQFGNVSGSGINGMIGSAVDQTNANQNALGIPQRYLAALNGGLYGNTQLGQQLDPSIKTAGNLIGGQPGQYGASDALLQNIQQGLPGQLTIQGLTGSQAGIGGQNQQSASQLLQAMANGGLPMNQQLYNLGQQAYDRSNQNQLQPFSVNAQTAGMPDPAQALGTQAQRLFNQQYNLPQIGAAGQAQNPDFFNSLIGRAFGAGQGLSTPSVGASTIQGPSQVGTPGIQDAVTQRLQGLISGSGLSPEYVQAARDRILAPSQEALRGQLNEQMGGVGDINAGPGAEMQRRLEENFNKDLLLTGQGNLANYLSQGAGLGNQQFGQGVTNQQLGQQAQQFNAQQQQQANLANQGSALQTQGLGVNAGLQGLGLLPGLASTDISRQVQNSQLALQPQLANQQAAAQQAGLGLQASSLGGGLLGQQAGIAANLAQFNPQLNLQAQLANQNNALQSGFGNAQLGLQNANLARGIGQDYMNLGQNVAGQQAALGNSALGNAMTAYGQNQLPLNFINSAGQLGSQLGNQNTNNYTAMANQALNFLQGAQGAAQAPGNFMLNAAGQALGNQNSLANMIQQQIGNQQGAANSSLANNQQLYNAIQNQTGNQLGAANASLNNQNSLFNMLQGNVGQAQNFLNSQNQNAQAQNSLAQQIYNAGLGSQTSQNIANLQNATQRYGIDKYTEGQLGTGSQVALRLLGK